MRTGADYLAAIAGDGRTVLLDGEPVADVSTHPGFAGPARVIASLYDSALERTDLAFEDAGRSSSAMWLIPRSADDLAARRRVHRHWAEGSFGLMGRTPDHVASLITGFAGARQVFDRGGSRFGDSVVAFYEKARAADWFIAYAITPAPGRSLQAGAPPARAVPVPRDRRGARRRHRDPRGADDRHVGGHRRLALPELDRAPAARRRGLRDLGRDAAERGRPAHLPAPPVRLADAPARSTTR